MPPRNSARSAILLIDAPRTTGDQINDVRAALASLGLDVDVRPGFRHDPTAELAWWVFITLLASGFFNGFGQEAGKDAWKILRRTIERIGTVMKASGHPPGGVVLRDDETRTEILLDADLPAVAYRLLVDQHEDLLWSHRGQRLRFDRKAREWIPSTAGEGS